MKILIKISIVILFFITTGCSENDRPVHDNSTDGDVSNTVSVIKNDSIILIESLKDIDSLYSLSGFGQVPEGFRMTTTDLYDAYRSIAMSLYLSNLDHLAGSIILFRQIYSLIDDSGLSSNQQNKWDPFAAHLIEVINEIENSGDLITARMQFMILDKMVKEIIECIGSIDRFVYRFLCDDVLFTDTAFWYADTKEVQNPYLGQTSGCGELIETIEFKSIFIPKR